MEWKRYLKEGPAPAAESQQREPFDAAALGAEIDQFSAETDAVSVPGGWEQVRTKQPERWRRLMVAFKAIDDAFARQDAAGVRGAITAARRALATV